MNERKITYSNRKRIPILLSGIGISVTALFLIVMQLISQRSINLYDLLLPSLLFLTGLILILIYLKKVFSSNQIGLMLDSEGLVFNGTPVGKKVGKVEWKNVAAIRSGRAHGSSQLFIKLKEAKKHQAEIADGEAQKVIVRPGLQLNSSELDIAFHEMETLVMQYYHQYHNVS